ncbi:MAG: phosphate acyltransferase, partial [Rubritepida sp.]|nr:phosphate acyltransferase [Rubritepida sp.]
MGGDHAPEAVLAGLELAAERHPGARFLLMGDEARLLPLLAAYPRARAACTIRHTAVAIPGDMKPTLALRLRGSSMRLANDAVAAGEVQGVVSAGTTGALMALAKIVIKTLPEIDR